MESVKATKRIKLLLEPFHWCLGEYPCDDIEDKTNEGLALQDEDSVLSVLGLRYLKYV